MNQVPLFFIPIVIGGIIQCMKICIDFLVSKKLSRKSIWTSGGFPSTHAGITASITTLMLIHYGYASAEFAMSFCFSFLFWYDAVNVRYEAGQHASYINKISEELDDIFDLGGKMVLLKERLGHTFIEVVGGIMIGITFTVVWYDLFLA
jgi:acid phosphatase family membrane protein YuiD